MYGPIRLCYADHHAPVKPIPRTTSTHGQGVAEPARRAQHTRTTAMKGLIKTFVPEKKYGFIKGDDGKDYYFHQDSFGDQNHKDRICDDSHVEFEPAATPKGYRAQNCSLLIPSDVTTYVVPDDLLMSESATIRGWEVIEWGEWTVCGTSRDSPDAAKRQLIGMARCLGANALIGITYSKSIGSEAGTGQGTHHYTIHHFTARIMTVAKKSAKGVYDLDDLRGLNSRAAAEKQRFARLIRRRNVTWAVILTLSVLFLTALRDNDGLGFGLLVVGIVALYRYFSDRATDYGDWLKDAQCV
jgi:cold shock CspA family protein